MKSVEIKLDAEDARDGLAPVWRWRVLLDGRRVAEGVEPFMPLAQQKANRALTAAL